MSTGSIHGQAVPVKEKSTYLNYCCNGPDICLVTRCKESILFLVPHAVMINVTFHLAFSFETSHACYFTRLHDAGQWNQMWTCEKKKFIRISVLPAKLHISVFNSL